MKTKIRVLGRSTLAFIVNLVRMPSYCDESAIYRNWLWRFSRAFPIRVPILPQMLIALLLYTGAVVAAKVSGIFENPMDFFRVYPSVHWAIFGIVWSLIGTQWGITWGLRTVKHLEEYIETSHETDRKLLYSNVSAIFNNKFSLYIGFLSILFIARRAQVHFPAPIPQFASTVSYTQSYMVLDWYTLAIFFIVMLIFGSGVWMIFRGLFSLHRILKIHFKLEKLGEIPPMATQLLIFAMFGWFIGVGLCAPVLTRQFPSSQEFLGFWNPITVPTSVLILQLGVGLILFLVPQYFLYIAIKSSKTRELIGFRHNYYIHMANFEKRLTNSISDQECFRYYSLITTLDNIMRRIENIKEWYVLEARTITWLLGILAIPVTQFILTARIQP